MGRFAARCFLAPTLSPPTVRAPAGRRLGAKCPSQGQMSPGAEHARPMRGGRRCRRHRRYARRAMGTVQTRLAAPSSRDRAPRVDQPASGIGPEPRPRGSSWHQALRTPLGWLAWRVRTCKSGRGTPCHSGSWMPSPLVPSCFAAPRRAHHTKAPSAINPAVEMCRKTLPQGQLSLAQSLAHTWLRPADCSVRVQERNPS